MVEQNPSNHIDSLHVAHLNIIDGVSNQHIFQHESIFDIFGKGGAFRMRPCDIFIYLSHILLLRLLGYDLFESKKVVLVNTFCPLLLPGADLITEAAMLTHLEGLEPTQKAELVPVEKRFESVILHALSNDGLASSEKRSRVYTNFAA